MRVATDHLCEALVLFDHNDDVVVNWQSTRGLMQGGSASFFQLLEAVCKYYVEAAVVRRARAIVGIASQVNP